MQISKVSFTSNLQIKKQNENKQSTLYNKQNFIQIGGINDFIAGSAIGFGILESRDKFKLLTKEKTLPGALKELAKKHTKRNVLIGLGIGALYAIIDMALMKKFSPNLEKMYDKLDEIEKSKKTEDKV